MYETNFANVPPNNKQRYTEVIESIANFLIAALDKYTSKQMTLNRLCDI